MARPFPTPGSLVELISLNAFRVWPNAVLTVMFPALEPTRKKLVRLKAFEMELAGAVPASVPSLVHSL